MTAKRFWQLFTGSAVAVAGLAVYERVAGHNASWTAYFAVMGVCLILALTYQGFDQFKRLHIRLEICDLTRRVWPVERHGFCGAEYFISVRNLSEAEALENVRVELVKLEPDVIEFLPVPLHIKHDEYDGSREFSINGGSFRQIDILTGPVNHPRSQKQMVIPHTVNTDRFPIPYGKYLMTIQASAKGAKPVVAQFQAWIDNDGELRCVPWFSNSTLMV